MAGPWAAAVVEIAAAIVGACLPVLPPIWFCLRRKSRRRLSRSRNKPPTPGYTEPRLSSSRRSKKSKMSAAMQSIVTIGRISSHNNHHNNRRRLTLTETGFELEGTRFERIESLVDSEASEANPVVMQAGEQPDGEGESDARSQSAYIGDLTDRRVSTFDEVSGGPERIQQIEKGDVIEPTGTAS